MQTIREAAEPSKLLGEGGRHQPDRHYVKLQKAIGRWDDDDVAELMNEVDPRTGEMAYRMEADGGTPGGTAKTGKVNACILSCSASYMAFKQTQIDGQSMARKNAIMPTGDSHEYDASADFQSSIAAATKPTSIPEMIKVMGAAVAVQAQEKAAAIKAGATNV